MPTQDNLNILIVDDDPLVTHFLKRIITNMGNNIIGTCSDGISAHQTIENEKPDVVFMDINIKGPKDGITVIKELSFNTDTSIIYISSYSQSDILDEALETNPSNYLIKPLKEEDVKIALSLIKQKKNKSKPTLVNKLIFEKNFYYDYDLQELVHTGNSLKLSAIESKLVDIFIENRNANLSIEYIKTLVWDEKDTADSTVRDKISTLRKKIPLFPIQTNFGRGYVLNIEQN